MDSAFDSFVSLQRYVRLKLNPKNGEASNAGMIYSLLFP